LHKLAAGDIKIDGISVTWQIADFVMTAKIQDDNGNPVVGKQVIFALAAGPNMDTTGNGVTGSKGQVTFSSVGNVVGIDTIVASFVNNAGKTFPFNEIINKWENDPNSQLSLSPLVC